MKDNQLIFSTKDIPSKPVWGIWVTMIIVPILSFISFPVVVAAIFTGIVIGACIVGVVRNNISKQSYIDIYSDKISGCDAGNGTNPTLFEIQYNEITRLDSQQDIVRIYWSGGCYIVRTPNCEQKVIELIKQQKLSQQ